MILICFCNNGEISGVIVENGTAIHQESNHLQGSLAALVQMADAMQTVVALFKLGQGSR